MAKRQKTGFEVEPSPKVEFGAPNLFVVPLSVSEQMSAVETGQMSSVETEQMSAVETGQMSAAETGQMSAVETRQMYSIQTGLRPVSIVDICLVSTCTSKDRKAR